MSDLLFLFDQYAILESFSHQIAFGDLLSLSRTNSSYRAVLHGIQNPSVEPEYIQDSTVRSSIRVGAANTGLWRVLKGNAQQVCSEPTHIRGDNPGGCRMCSMPVCGACIVRSSFKKNENTFTQRRRYFCDQCWAANIPHQERLHYRGDHKIKLAYAQMDTCQCTAKDGIICTQCRQEFRQHDSDDTISCAGLNCGRILVQDTVAGRICTWCKLSLPTRSLERSWSDFEQRKCMSWDPIREAAREEARAAERQRQEAQEERQLRRANMTVYDDQRFDVRLSRRRSSVSSSKSTKAPSESDRSEHTLVGDHQSIEETATDSTAHRQRIEHGVGCSNDSTGTSDSKVKAPPEYSSSEHTFVGFSQDDASDDRRSSRAQKKDTGL